jgi:cytochrome c oxidase assembly protein subunit 15
MTHDHRTGRFGFGSTETRTGWAGNRYAIVALVAVALCLVVVTLGAYVRLTHAGLGCPDWPGCYGEVTWPTKPHQIERANEAFPERPVEVGKAWREVVHRMAAGVLMLLVMGLAFATHWHVRHRRWQIAAAPLLVGLATLLYTAEAPWLGLGTLALALAVLLHGAATWRDSALGRLAVVMFALILVQALFGKWTVTLKLKPIIVTTHLIGGMTMFALLAYFMFRAAGWAYHGEYAPKRAAIVVAIALVAIQIALGGWVTSNYAALACGMDFPKCAGRWWPEMDFAEALVLWRGIGVDFEGGVLDAEARKAIQMMHRLFALLVVGHVGMLAIRMLDMPQWRRLGIALGLVLAAQVALGIANVWFGLPLAVATAHNGGAALLLLVLMGMLAKSTKPNDRLLARPVG